MISGFRSGRPHDANRRGMRVPGPIGDSVPIRGLCVKCHDVAGMRSTGYSVTARRIAREDLPTVRRPFTDFERGQ